MAKIAKGAQGTWFATTSDGERLPCVLKEYWPGGRYHDPYHYDQSSAKCVEYIAAVKRGRVLMTRNEGSYQKGWLRKGYIGIFLVDDVKYSPDHGLSFNIRERLRKSAWPLKIGLTRRPRLPRVEGARRDTNTIDHDPSPSL
jgi:hypothetical protein